jgi:acetoin utilization deacetylase AcuC-like enzyme
MTAFVSSPAYVHHDNGPFHPERPDRLRAIHRAIRAAGLVDSPDPFTDFEIDLGPIRPAGAKLLEIAPLPATVEQLTAVHPIEHVNAIRRTAQAGGGQIDADTRVSAQSYDLALLSAGAAITACDAVMTGRARRAFAAARPPGHHAEPDRAMGFCLFSNVAVAARHLQRSHGVGKIAIVDFDVHHGNGTQAAFEDDPSVFFCSMHEDPRTCYPGSGHAWEKGVGPGVGTTLNVPFPPNSDDDDYRRAMAEQVLPAVEAFRPEVLMISAGFDAHLDDPLAHIALSEQGFEDITRALVALADRQCGGRVISTLEGGYDLRALARSVVRHLVALST